MEYELDDPYVVDAAWLDFTGPLTSARLKLLGDYYERCVRSILIVTVLNSRETGLEEIVGDKHMLLQRTLPGEVVHAHEYCDTVPMLQFAVRRNGPGGAAE